MLPNNNIFNIILYTSLLSFSLNSIYSILDVKLFFGINNTEPHFFFIFMIFIYTIITNILLVILFSFSYLINYQVPFLFNIHYIDLIQNYNMIYANFIITIKNIIFTISYTFYMISFFYTFYLLFFGFDKYIIKPPHYFLQYFIYVISTFLSAIFIFIFTFNYVNNNIGFFDILYFYKLITYYFQYIYINKPLLAKNIIHDILKNSYKIIDIKTYLNYRKIKCYNCECIICLDTYNENQYYILLDCLHKYHFNCIFKWINEKIRFTCPLCRKEYFI